MMRPHVWRYDAVTPTADRPWIVSLPGSEPADFPTWDEAIGYAVGLASVRRTTGRWERRR